ncbi:MAG TPA: MFS transporter [Bryobacteraceae bacterium]|jgi:MFS family permease
MKKGLLLSLAVLFLINILNFYDRNVAGALAEPMKKEFNLSDSQIGLLGSVFIWVYALIGVPLGFMADRMKRKTLLAAGVVVWALLTAMNAFAQNFTHLLFARLGVGVGEAVVAPSATSWIGDLVPTAKRARAMAVFMLGVPIGGALSYFFSGPIAQHFGWRTALVIAALPAILLVPPLLLLREPKRGESDGVGAAIEGGIRPSMWSVLRIPTLLWIIASGALLNFNMYAYGTFTVSFLMRIHGQMLSTAGILTGVIMLIGGVAGGLIAGRVGDRIVGKRKDGRLLAAALFALAGAPVAYFGVIQQKGSLTAAIILLTLAYGSCNTYYGLVYSSIHEIVVPSLRATTMAIYFMCMYMCGASFGPLLTGTLSDWRAHVAAAADQSTVITAVHKAIGLQQAMLIIPLLGMLLAAVLWAGSRTISADIARRESLAAQPVNV